MNDRDRRTLEAMDTRELADIGISRGDLPRLFAESSFMRRWSAAANRQGATGRVRLRNRTELVCQSLIIKACSVVSAVLITWALVYAVTQGAGPVQALVYDLSRPRDAADTVVAARHVFGFEPTVAALTQPVISRS